MDILFPPIDLGPTSLELSVLRAYQEQVSIPKIARRYQISEATVRKWLAFQGILTPCVHRDQRTAKPKPVPREICPKLKAILGCLEDDPQRLSGLLAYLQRPLFEWNYYAKWRKTKTGKAFCEARPLCEIAGCEYPATIVDHCHRTGRIRGHICCRCNSAEGILSSFRRDYPDLTLEAIFELLARSL